MSRTLTPVPTEGIVDLIPTRSASASSAHLPIDPGALLQQVSMSSHSAHPSRASSSRGDVADEASRGASTQLSRAPSVGRSHTQASDAGASDQSSSAMGNLPLGPIPRPLSSSATRDGFYQRVGGSAAVYAGTLFPSFDAEANYHAKQAEMRKLGFDMGDDGRESAAADVTSAADQSSNTATARPLSSSYAAAGRSQEREEEASDLRVIERQIKRRDELYIAAQRRADEAKEYAAMITHLRAEAKRSEVVRKDVHSSLVSQVEALQYVVQRRNDADNQAAKVRFVDVENEVITISKEVDEEAEEQLKRIGRLGEESLCFVEQLSAQASSFVRVHQNEEILEVELRETQSVLLQQVTIRMQMVTDRVRSESVKSLSSDMRARYTVSQSLGAATGGHGAAARLTPELRSLLSSYGSSDVNSITEQLRGTLVSSLSDVEERTWASIATDIPQSIESTLRAVEAVGSRTLEDAVRLRVKELDAEAGLLQSHLQDSSVTNDQRRVQEEHALRDVVLDMGKLLETQRLAMNDLRTQLLLQAKVAIAASPPQRSQRHKSKSPGVQHTSRPRGASASKSGGGRNPRQASPATSRRLLFEPLSEDQIKSLYGALPTQATVVEEVSVERLSRITSKAQLNKKSTPHEQDQLILVSRQPASLIGRGSSQRVPTTLTAPIPSTSSGGVARAQGGGGKSPAAGLKGTQQVAVQPNQPNAYNSGELATLQELRRLRVKLDRRAP